MISIRINDKVSKLVADNGRVIMSKNMDAENPYFSDVVYLGVDDNKGNYVEISEEEAQRITDAAEEKKRLAQLEAEKEESDDKDRVDMDSDVNSVVG